MSFLFGKQKTPQEMLREHQRALRKTMREMERERIHLQNQEKKLIIEIKKMAKLDQLGAARVMAKDLVRTRAQVQKFYQMHSQLQAVSLRIQTVKSTATMASAMAGVTRAMAVMNQSLNMPAMQRIMMEFERQSEVMDMKQEMMEDTMDDIFETENEDLESEEIFNQVLDELNISMKESLAAAPQQDLLPSLPTASKKLVKEGENGASSSRNDDDDPPAPSGGSGGGGGGGGGDDDLLARLQNLRQ